MPGTQPIQNELQETTMKNLLPILLLLISLTTFGQKKKNYFPVWTYHQRNINIHGVSVGAYSIRDKPRNTNTNGIKLELIGIGFFIPLIPQSPVAQTDSSFIQFQNEPISERINGISLSATGTACDCIINGITAGLVGQIQYKVNGISAAILMNFTQIHNGIQGGLFNETYKMSGLQIGGFNKSHKTKGIQIGLWNINEKRKLPIFNWNF
jgi:hypothetical protein